MSKENIEKEIELSKKAYVKGFVNHAIACKKNNENLDDDTITKYANDAIKRRTKVASEEFVNSRKKIASELKEFVLEEAKKLSKS